MNEWMDPERWSKLQVIYSAAVKLPQPERAAFLDQACAGDDELRGEAESLLTADDEAADEFLDNGAFTLGMKVLAAQDANENPMSSDTTLRFETNPEGQSQKVLDGRYRILGELDGGGMGEVFTARDLKFPDRLVVVKVMKKESQSSAWKIKKFRAEGKAQSRVQHANVATVFDTGDLPSGEPYLVMEFVKGSTLWERINERKIEDVQMDFAEVVEIMQQISRGVSAIHKANLIHRDVKPKNIMVFEDEDTGELTVKVIDFGIVRDLDRSTVPGQSVGTLPYMSPEQINGDEVTQATDIYALGVIAYQMLTNHLPFNAQTYTQIYAMQMEGVKVKPGDLRRGLPQAAEHVLLRALSYNPTDRQQTAREFGDELKRALVTESKQQPTPQPSPSEATTLPMRIPSPLNKWWLAAAALLIAIFGVTLWGISRMGKDHQPTATPANSPPQGVGTERQLTYWLTIVRQRDGKTISATGRETFDTGDEFRFHVTPAQAGALYIFNEGPSGSWHLLFPTPQNNQGNAGLAAEQTVATRENVFTNKTGREKGTEKIWLVWATQSVQSLDEIVRQSFNGDLTISNTAQQATLQQFMAAHRMPTQEAMLDKERSSVTIKRRGEIFAYLLELEHKDWK